MDSTLQKGRSFTQRKGDGNDEVACRTFFRPGIRRFPDEQFPAAAVIKPDQVISSSIVDGQVLNTNIRANAVTGHCPYPN